MISLTQGILISIEGIDGSGKSTLAKTLYENLCQQFSIVLTKEPGATELGKQLRKILQEQPMQVEPKAEFLLFAADRAQHISQIVLPALTEKKIVISDRMSDSSLAYQGYGRGLSLHMISTINAWTMQNIIPDITLFIEVPLETALERIVARKQKVTAFENNHSFTQKIIEGFEIIFKDRPNVIRLNGLDTQEIITDNALQGIVQWMKQNNMIQI